MDQQFPQAPHYDDGYFIEMQEKQHNKQQEGHNYKILENQNEEIFSDWQQKSNSGIQLQGQRDMELYNHKENLQELIYGKIKHYWVDKTQQVKKSHVIQPHHKTQHSTDLKNVIKLGLEVQQYIGQDTQFYHLYTQQIQKEFSRFKYQKQHKNFVKKAKLMLEKYIDKYDDVKAYLLFPLNWVKQSVPSYPHLIKNPLCIKQIQHKLRLNLYDNFESFLGDMSKIFDDFLLFSQNNKQFELMILKLRNNWTNIKNEVLQLKNLGIQPFINPLQEKFISQILDFNEEISLLRERVSIEKNISELLDYDPEFLVNNNLKNNNLKSNSEEKRKKSFEEKKLKLKIKQQTKRIFISNQSFSKTIEKQRILELKKNISKCIVAQMSQKDLEKRKFLKYIHQKKISNPNFIGRQNEINLQILQYEEFIELEEMVQKQINFS